MGRAYILRRIQKHIALILCAAFLLTGMASMTCFAAEESARKVRVGYAWSANFSEGESDEEYKSGYAYEYLQKVAYYTGWQYEYVYGDWSTILDMLERGEVDVMAGIAYTEERSRVLDFPDFPMGTEHYYIYVRQNSTLASKDVIDIEGLHIGCIEGSIQDMILDSWDQNGEKDFTVEKFPGTKEMYKAFSQHAIDAVVDTDNAVLPTDGLVPIAKVGSSDYYLAVAKGRDELLAQLNRALEKINNSSPYYLQNLYNKYFSETAVVMSLSPQEREWLSEHPSIKVGYMNQYMPYCGTDKQGKTTGLLVDLFENMFSKLSMEQMPAIEYVAFDNQKDMITAVNDGDVDVAFPVFCDIWFSEMQGLYQTTDIADVMVDLVYKGNYNNLSMEKIGVNRDNLIQYQFTVKQYPKAEIIYYDTIDECLEAVVKGDIDCTIINGLRTDALIGKDYYKSLNSVELTDTSSLTMGVKRGNVELLTLLNHGLHTLDKNFAMANSYKYENNIPVYTAKDFIRENMLWVLLLVVLIAAIIAFFLLRYARHTRRYLAQEKELTKNLENALKAARQANQAKTIFLNSMSHDIRTPLNGILGLLEINERHADDRQLIDENRKKIKVAANHLLSLISDVLQYSRIGDEGVQLAQEPFDMMELTRDVMTIIELRAAETGISVQHPFYPEGYEYPYVYGSPLHVRQIMINILDNAIKYNKPGGSISCDMKIVDVDENRVTYQAIISDTGIGMSKEFMEHMFEAFSQEHSDARSVYQGTGLGMAIVKGLVDKMGGTIEVTSELDVGSTFVVTVPFAIASAEEIPKKVDVAEVDLEGKKILVAEDNVLNMEIAKTILGDMGAVITEANNGKEAVEAFTENEPGTFDLILMDLMMPVMDGYEATKEIRAFDREDAANIPIVAMTANAFVEDAKKCIDAGMNGHLAKPIEMPKLIQLLSEVLS